MPWRFDDARNAALALVPADIDYCIALDVDEVLAPEWRKSFDRLDRRVTRPRYVYTWSWNDDRSPGLQYKGDKIHTRHGYRWKHPVHEVAYPYAMGTELMDNVALEIHHHPDPGKPRSYLPLLELAVRETPLDDRNAHYLGRDYFFAGRLEEAAAELKRHLGLASSQWPAERAKSMRLLSKCIPAEEEAWLLRACAEDPGQREVWCDLASFHYRAGRWQDSLSAAERCLQITTRELAYLSEPQVWGSEPDDLAAIACFRLGRFDAAVGYGQRALALAPNDKRLRANLQWYRSAQMGTGFDLEPVRVGCDISDGNGSTI